jgi:hypothetical protein
MKKKSKNRDKEYTVIGFYRDNNQPWMEHVRGATSPRDAAIMALDEVFLRVLGREALSGGIISSGDPCVSDPCVVEVIKGKVKGILGNEKLVDLTDGLLNELGEI